MDDKLYESYFKVINIILGGEIQVTSLDQIIDGKTLPKFVEKLTNKKIPNIKITPQINLFQRNQNNSSVLNFLQKEFPSNFNIDVDFNNPFNVSILLDNIFQFVLVDVNKTTLMNNVNNYLKILNIKINNFRQAWGNGENFIALLNVLTKGKVRFIQNKQPPYSFTEVSNSFKTAGVDFIFNEISLNPKKIRESLVMVQIKFILDKLEQQQRETPKKEIKDTSKHDIKEEKKEEKKPKSTKMMELISIAEGKTKSKQNDKSETEKIEKTTKLNENQQNKNEQQKSVKATELAPKKEPVKSNEILHSNEGTRKVRIGEIPKPKEVKEIQNPDDKPIGLIESRKGRAKSLVSYHEVDASKDVEIELKVINYYISPETFDDFSDINTYKFPLFLDTLTGISLNQYKDSFVGAQQELNKQAIISFLSKYDSIFSKISFRWDERRDQQYLIDLVLDKIFVGMRNTEMLQISNKYLYSYGIHVENFNISFAYGIPFIAMLDYISSSFTEGNRVKYDPNNAYDYDFIKEAFRKVKIPLILDEDTLFNDFTDKDIKYQLVFVLDKLMNKKLPNGKVVQNIKNIKLQNVIKKENKTTKQGDSNKRIQLTEFKKKLDEIYTPHKQEYVKIYYKKPPPKPINHSEIEIDFNDIDDEDEDDYKKPPPKPINHSQVEIDFDEDSDISRHQSIDSNPIEIDFGDDDDDNLLPLVTKNQENIEYDEEGFQKSSYINLINYILTSNKLRKINLITEISDGVTLPRLIQSLTGDKIDSIVENPEYIDQNENIYKCFHYLERKDKTFANLSFNFQSINDCQLFVFKVFNLFYTQMSKEAALSVCNYILTKYYHFQETKYFDNSYLGGQKYLALLNYLTHDPEYSNPKEEKYYFNEILEYFSKAKIPFFLINENVFMKVDQNLIFLQVTFILNKIKKNDPNIKSLIERENKNIAEKKSSQLKRAKSQSFIQKQDIHPKEKKENIEIHKQTVVPQKEIDEFVHGIYIQIEKEFSEKAEKTRNDIIDYLDSVNILPIPQLINYHNNNSRFQELGKILFDIVKEINMNGPFPNLSPRFIFNHQLIKNVRDKVQRADSDIIKRKITKFFDIEENKSKGHEETAEEHEMNKTNYVLRENVTLKEVLVEVNSNNEPKIEQEFEPDY